MKCRRSTGAPGIYIVLRAFHRQRFASRTRLAAAVGSRRAPLSSARRSTERNYKRMIQ